MWGVACLGVAWAECGLIGALHRALHDLETRADRVAIHCHLRIHLRVLAIVADPPSAAGERGARVGVRAEHAADLRIRQAYAAELGIGRVGRDVR